MKAGLRLIPLIAACSVVIACGHKNRAGQDSTAEQTKRVVNVAEVTAGPYLPPVVAVGVAANRDEAKLAFKVGGIIHEIRVREGDAIHKGNLLAILETDEVDAAVKQADEAHTKAVRDLERGRNLFAQEVITREQLDDLTTAEAMSRAGLKGASYNRDNAKIVASADGIVLRRLAETRELVAPGQPVLIVSSSRQGIVLQAGLPDRDVVKVHKEDRADLSFDAFPGQLFPGKVLEVSQATDPRTGTYRVEIESSKTDAGIISGMIGKALVYPAEAGDKSRSYVPVEALVEGDQKKAQLFILDPSGKVKSIFVGIAFIADDRIALNDDLAPGTKVVTEGASYLHDGEAVQVKQ